LGPGANVNYASKTGELEANAEKFQRPEGYLAGSYLFGQILYTPHVQKCRKWKYLFCTYIALLLYFF
jgi:hypothetical protein